DMGVQRLLAQSLRSQGRAPEAVAVLEAVLARSPGDPKSQMALGYLFYEMGEPAKAIPLLSQARNDPRRRRTVDYYLALALQRAGREDEARALFAETKKVREAEILVSESNQYPGHLGMRVRAARACVDAGDDEQALTLLRSVLAADPHHTEAHRLLADVYERQ